MSGTWSCFSGIPRRSSDRPGAKTRHGCSKSDAGQNHVQKSASCTADHEEEQPERRIGAQFAEIFHATASTMIVMVANVGCCGCNEAEDMTALLPWLGRGCHIGRASIGSSLFEAADRSNGTSIRPGRRGYSLESRTAVGRFCPRGSLNEPAGAGLHRRP